MRYDHIFRDIWPRVLCYGALGFLMLSIILTRTCLSFAQRQRNAREIDSSQHPSSSATAIDMTPYHEAINDLTNPPQIGQLYDPNTLLTTGGNGVVVMNPDRTFSARMAELRASTGRWYPNEETIQKAEARIATFIDEEIRLRSGTKQWMCDDLRAIQNRLPSYRRQYFALLEKGKRRILCNFFPPAPKHGHDQFDDWLTRGSPIGDDIDGGGANYWNVTYFVEEDKCELLSVHSSE